MIKAEIKRGKLIITIPVDIIKEENKIEDEIKVEEPTQDGSQQQEVTGENQVDTAPGATPDTGEQGQ